MLLVGDAAGIVSPLTAGGIHTALDSGWRTAHAIADHLMDGAPHPAHPRFLGKRGLRRLFELAPPDWLADTLIPTKPLHMAAETVYFHHRGLMSARAWSDVWKDQARRRATL